MTEALGESLQQAGFRLIETHISRVYIRGDDVFKIKRPVDLGFLDFSTLEARERACAAEVALNRRLAPDVYLGVEAVVRAADGGFSFVPQGGLVGRHVEEWAVHMRRLPDEERADVRLARGELQASDIARMAALLARFHREAACDARTAEFGRPEVIVGNVEENFAQVAPTLAEYLAESEREALTEYQRDFLRTERSRFEQRLTEQRVRDGHGDLRLEHLYRTPSHDYVAIDCIEFNERFRYGDVCADLAFLSMDLRYHGRADLAELLIADYARESADYGLYGLVDFYESYRAVVRAKVSAILAHDSSVAEATRERAQHEARRYYMLAIAEGRRPLRPARLIVTFGLIASGKSTLATALGRRLGAAVLSADWTRKELLGVAPTEAHHDPAFSGAYEGEISERVYDTLLARAEQILRSGRTVILDASFRARAHRARVSTLAGSLPVEATFFECRCPRAQTMERLARRAHEASVSDGRAEIFDAFAARFEPASELSRYEHAVLDTSAPLSYTMSRALERLE